MLSFKSLDFGVRRVQPGTLEAYVLAPVFVAIATTLCIGLSSAPPGVPFVLLFAAVVASAMICGIGAGLLALGVGSLAAGYLFSPPGFLPRWDNVRQFYGLVACILAAAAIVVWIGYMRRAAAGSRRAVHSLMMIFDAHPDAILLLDARGGITDANRRAAELFGKSRLTLIGTPFDGLFPARLRANIALLRASPKVVSRLPVARQDGAECPVDVQISSVSMGGKVQSIATLRTTGSSRPALTEHHGQPGALEDRPHSAEEMRVWADAFTHAAVGLTITDPTTRSLRFVNKAWAEMHGWDAQEVSGMPTSLFFPEDELPRLPAIYAEADRSGHVTFEVRRRRKDGSTFLAAFDVVTVRDAAGNPLYRVATSRDITSGKRSEEMLRHTTKMEAIGGLTGGMAHDFNNLLGAIILSLDFVKSEMSDQDHLKPFVAEAKSAAESGAELIRNLLAFARRQALHPTRIDVNDQVAGMHRLLSRVLGEEIAIVLHTTSDIWPVIADRAQLEGCLLNLATNARDAMPKGGSLTIATSNEHLGDDYVKQNPSVTPGDYVMIAVSDTGTGMTPDVVAKVFEPFFTTKEPGHGTGLGLSMVFGFATQSGGHVSVHSEPGVGTTMRLFLPRAHLLVAAANPAGAVAPALPAPPKKGDGETILVVEDNAVMRRVVVRQLAELNYVVHEVDNARTALEMLENGTVDLLFSDIVMPDGMDGFELAERVRARWSSVKVLLTSGFSGDQVSRRTGAVRTTARLLGKPYNLEELGRAVREALDG
jgi:PAS domain S-box-containing protein